MSQSEPNRFHRKEALTIRLDVDVLDRVSICARDARMKRAAVAALAITSGLSEVEAQLRPFTRKAEPQPT